MPEFTLHLGIKIPKLLELHAAFTQDQQPCTLYTEETCFEFQQLLCRLSKGFQAAINKLQELCHSEKEKPSANRPDAFQTGVSYASSYETVLQWIAYGSVIEQHLQNIESQLQYHFQAIEVGTDVVVASMEESDTKLLDLLPTVIWKGQSQLQSKWKTYRNWLRLIVTHFNVAETLIAYVKSDYFLPQHNISIKILTPPAMPTHKLLSLQSLLQDPMLWLPDMPDQTGVTNQDILTFLNKVKSLWPLAGKGHLSVMFRAFTSPGSPGIPSPKDLNKAVNGTKNLEKNYLKFPGWCNHIIELKRDLDQLIKSGTSNCDLEALTIGICDNVFFLHDSIIFFQQCSPH